MADEEEFKEILENNLNDAEAEPAVEDEVAAEEDVAAAADAPAEEAVAPAAPAAAAAAAEAKAKKERSEKQKDMQAKRNEKLGELRQMYAERFANIPEKERPKAKAYDAVALIAAKDPAAKLEEIFQRDRKAYNDKKAGIKPPPKTRKVKVVEALLRLLRLRRRMRFLEPMQRRRQKV